MLKYSYIQHIEGHENSKGEDAPWVIKDHETDEIISSHKTKSEAEDHLKDMHIHASSYLYFTNIKTSDDLLNNENNNQDMSDITEDVQSIIERPTKINTKIRNKLNSSIKNLTTRNGEYFNKIPIQEMMSALEDVGYTLLDESGNQWEGMLVGEQGRANIGLGALQSDGTYAPVKNALFTITWYKMRSGRYEIIAYIS